MAVKNDISLQTARSCFNPAESKIHCGSQHPFVDAKENGSPAAVVAATMSASDSILPARPLRHNRAGLSGITPESPWAVARAFLSENHPLDERGLVGVWNEGEGGEWLRDNQGSALPRGY